MPAKLLYRQSDGKDAVVDLPQEGAFLGRAVDCVVRTDDAMVSRKNCKVSQIGGRWFVEDLGSANGTFLNERRIQKEVMSHGDVIRCGSLQVRFVIVADTPQGATPANGIAGQSSSTSAPIASQNDGVPKPIHAGDKTDHVPVAKVDSLEPLPANRPTRAEPPVVDPAASRKRDDEAKKLGEEKEAAVKAAEDAKAQLEQAVSKLEGLEEEKKRLVKELQATKDAAGNLRRQSQQDEQELREQTKVNEELRKDVRQLKEQLGQARTQVEDSRVQLEGKDRQLATAADEVRRAKQQADGQSLRMQEIIKERDSYLKAINEQRGDVDHLREILKERERMLEEKRVGLINLESQVKDLRVRSDGLEKELLTIRGERDNLKDRLSRSQVQVEELRSEVDRLGNALTNQQDTGPQLIALSKENGELRVEVQTLQGDLRQMEEEVEQAKAAVAQVDKLQATVKQLEEEHKAARQKLKDQAEQAATKAVRDATEALKVRFEEERSRLIRERDEALLAGGSAAAPDPARLHQLEEQLASLQTECDGLRETLRAKETAIEADRRDSGEQIHKLSTQLADERATLGQAQAALAAAQSALAAAQASQASQAPPSASSSAPSSDQALAEFKSVIATAHDGIRDFLLDLKQAVSGAQDSFERMERSIPDRDAARKLQGSFELAMEKFDEARGHIRSLRSLID